MFSGQNHLNLNVKWNYELIKLKHFFILMLDPLFRVKTELTVFFVYTLFTIV